MTPSGDLGWTAPSASGPLAATVALPGSKSLTNRVLVLAALSVTPTLVTAPLRARDTTLMCGALRSLGVRIDDEGADWRVHPGRFSAGPVDCGLAGTVMRFVPPLAGFADGDSCFDGDPHARTRPMRTLLDGLRQAGLSISDDGTGGLPFTVHGNGSIGGGRVELDASASSQFVSALLLAGARFDKGLEIHHVGASLPSLPHIEMSLACLAEAGVEVDASQPNRWVVVPGAIDLPDTVIEPDLSNAAPFLAAALVCGGSVTVPHWPATTTQPGDLLRELFTHLGAEVRLAPDGLTVTGPGLAGLRPLVADLHEASELTPVIAAICALAPGRSRLSGVAHIRGHETDRLAALRTELAAAGSDVSETEDGLVIGPAPLHPAVFRAYADHRMAQAGAVLGLAVPGVVVDDIASTTKTLADFPGLWQSLLAQRETPAG
ncbi:3-phosphoshikimate 1-carboxyvinyltransferase [Jatrophihabitans telluris]|uniref:3-phosphoshikimate 1-carboxyvinyltransferase n=2 Tax=Jatrophihabitans telluris TaxID=2038343 RepID=A0ABY4R243_9ACTN|nr:3-phosphoshikimate 1-carboxyvinyltransferase [Jatrophihabitans telluris]UQX89800.1 3-phosphoshikimate 1-carboxyvinyltransferase [Jatrophihabitans telluris]